MRKLLLILFTLSSCLMMRAQTKTGRDSLQQLLKTSKEDSNKVKLLYQYGEFFEQESPDSATFFYNKAKVLAEKTGYIMGVANYSSYQIVILNNKAKFREALAVAIEALEIFKKHGNKRDLCVGNLNVGSEWEYLSDFSTAAEYYLKAKKIADEIQDKRLQRIISNNLASAYIQLKEEVKGLAYAKEAYSIASAMKDKTAQANTLCNIGTAEIQLKNYDAALKIFKEVNAIGAEENDNYNIASGWLGMADAYKGKENFATAIKYYDTVLRFSKQEELPEFTMYADMGISEALIKSGQYKNAISYIN
ncbi:MAG: tetratricopeptide repeat protein, partial [Niabella sp.]